MKSSVLFTVGANCVRPWETAGLPYEQKTIRKKQYEQKMIRKKQTEKAGSHKKVWFLLVGTGVLDGPFYAFFHTIVRA